MGDRTGVIGKVGLGLGGGVLRGTGVEVGDRTSITVEVSLGRGVERSTAVDVEGRMDVLNGVNVGMGKTAPVLKEAT